MRCLAVMCPLCSTVRRLETHSLEDLRTQAHGSSELKTDETMEDLEDEHENAIGLREDVESGLEEVGPRMRCLAFMDAELGARLSGTLQAIGCNEDADAIAALAAFSKALFKVRLRSAIMFSSHKLESTAVRQANMGKGPGQTLEEWVSMVLGRL